VFISLLCSFQTPVGDAIDTYLKPQNPIVNTSVCITSAIVTGKGSEQTFWTCPSPTRAYEPPIAQTTLIVSPSKSHRHCSMTKLPITHPHMNVKNPR